jgi:hypothetical protein
MKQNKDTFLIDVKVEVSKDDIANIMVTAIEGGIGYWACFINEGDDWDNKPQELSTSEHAARLLLNGKTIKFYDTDEDFESAEKWELNLNKLLKGIKKYIQENNVIMFMDDLDANAADNIIQYALFGELVYG